MKDVIIDTCVKCGIDVILLYVGYGKYQNNCSKCKNLLWVQK